MEPTEDFEEERQETAAGPGAPFVVDVDGYEGPIDMLLTLAREQKVDLTQISILQLADQYLAFIARIRDTDLELAADYLVMAAWLAYLKSRLLLPEMGGEEEPSGEEMAAALAFQLRRLEAIQEAGGRLMARNRLGHDFFIRGCPESFVAAGRTVFEVSLYDLLKGYGGLARRIEGKTLHIEAIDLYSVEDALARLQRLLGSTPDWQNMARFLPQGVAGGPAIRSAVATTFAASLELVREGRLRLRQGAAFGPIYLRAVAGGPRKRERDGT